MQYAVKDLDGLLLELAVAKAEGYSQARITEFEDRTAIEVEFNAGGGRYVWVTHQPHLYRSTQDMRAFVAASFGEEVELP
jgi:hypothetical protein